MLEDIVCHQHSQLLLPVQVTTVLLAFLERRWDYFLAHFILGLSRRVRKWGETGASVSFHPLDDLLPSFI